MKKRNMLIGTVLTVTVLATSSAMVFASSETIDGVSSDNRGFGGNRDKAQHSEFVQLTDEQKTELNDSRNEILNDALTNLVNEGTFTQEEADAIIEAVPEKPIALDDQTKRSGFKVKGNSMIQSLTVSQRNVLKEKVELLSKESIDELVTSGVITQEQADLLALREQRPMKNSNRKTNTDNEIKEITKIDFTDEQKVALQDSRKSAMEEAVAELVDEEILTQEEADGIIEAVPEKPMTLDDQTKCRGFKIKGNGIMQDLTDTQKIELRTEIEILTKDYLEQLVEDGTITQDQANQKINRFYNKRSFI